MPIVGASIAQWLRAPSGGKNITDTSAANSREAKQLLFVRLSCSTLEKNVEDTNYSVFRIRSVGLNGGQMGFWLFFWGFVECQSHIGQVHRTE